MAASNKPLMHFAHIHLNTGIMMTTNQTDFSIIQEMRCVPNLIREFNPQITATWRESINRYKKLLLTGEGSSRIFPARNMMNLALRQGTDWTIVTEGARQSASYNLDHFTVIGASNSGQTKELVHLLSTLNPSQTTRFALTAQAGSAITTLSDDHIVLSCGTEKAVAATKSVIEQSLIVQSLLNGPEWKHQEQAADFIQIILDTPIDYDILASVANAACLYFAGAHDGVAEELTLKSYEITRKRAVYLEGTYVLHGVEEVMQEQDALILIEPHRDDLEKIRTIIDKAIGIPVIAFATYDTGFPTIRIPSLDGFDGYIRLCAGWQLLIAIGLHNGINLDKTARARKQGNAV
jgi:glucosamine--fructose-6-phosphate aminotransferase (isomerizing)